jgi:RND family efflux transporter MFP subunit
MKRQKYLVILVASLLIVACDQETGPRSGMPTAVPAPVRTAEVASFDERSRVRTVGILAPQDEIRLAFKTGGVVDHIDVEAGDRVREGQVLAVLKSTEIDAAVASAREAAENAKLDLDRGRRLREDEVVTDELVEDLATAYRVASANLRSARFNARFARIESPAGGLILDRLAEPNELVQGGQPVLVLGATGEGWVVRAALADRDVVRVEIGNVAQLRFDAFPGRNFIGTVSRIASSADRQTGTFEVEIRVDAEDARFARGLVARVDLALEDPAENGALTVVPLTALVEADGVQGLVFTLDSAKNVARRQPVVVGEIFGDRVVVRSGLEPGQLVITDGAAWLSDGEPVRVTQGTG